MKCSYENGAKEKVRVPFSDNDLSQIRHALSEDISNSESKHRQDVPHLRYTKNQALLNLRFSRHKRSSRYRPGAILLTSVTSRTSAAKLHIWQFWREHFCACSIYYWAEHILFFSVDIDNTPAGRWSAGSFPEHRLVIDPILAHGLLEYRHTDDVTGSLCSLFNSIC